MFENLIVPVDDSTASERAVVHAVSLADACDATFHAVSVFDAGQLPESVRGTEAAAAVESEAVERARPVLEAVAETCAESGVDCETAFRTGDPSAELAGYAEDLEGVCVVAGWSDARGAFGFVHEALPRRLLGATGEPVFAVPGHDESESPAVRDVLVAADARESDAASTALDLAETVDATLHGVHVVDGRFARGPLADALREAGEEVLDDLEAEANARGIDVRTDLREGSVADRLAGYAADADVDLVVAGASARPDVDRALGRVTRHLLRESPVPVLAAPGTAGE